MWAVFEALTFRSGGIVFHWTVSDREDRVLRQFTHFFHVVVVTTPLNSYPRPLGYTNTVNMASRRLLMSKSAVKEVNYLKNWKTKHRLWGNLFKCVCKQGLQNREDMAILHTISVRRYVRLQFLHESAKTS